MKHEKRENVTDSTRRLSNPRNVLAALHSAERKFINQIEITYLIENFIFDKY